MKQETADIFDIQPPQSPATIAITVIKAVGCARVMWPSGRITLEMYGGNTLITPVEQMMARGNLLAAKEENLRNTMRDFSQRTVQNGYWVRWKRRRKARRIISVEWLKPSTYDGPKPDRWGILV